jgi:Na+-transporting methylmalonyl-CoA/oxaloacetate decarboxylase gamma subunit
LLAASSSLIQKLSLQFRSRPRSLASFLLETKSGSQKCHLPQLVKESPMDLGILNTVIAMVIVLLVLSLLVQSVQMLLKKILKLKSKQIEDSLKDLFDQAIAGATQESSATAGATPRANGAPPPQQPAGGNNPPSQPRHDNSVWQN